MLHSLTIHNYLFVKSLHLDFYPSFTVLTGETGAGKSILLEALTLALGGRPQTQSLNKDPIEITASFKIQATSPLYDLLREYQITFADQMLILKRVIAPEGQGSAFLNNHRVPLSLLKEVAKNLIDIHGQFDYLTSPSTQAYILDSFGNLTIKREILAEKFQLWKHHQKNLEDLENSLRTLNQEKDWLEHAVAAFQKVSPQENEETTLLEKRTFFMNFSKTADILKNLQELVGEQSSMETTLKNAARLLHKTATEDQKSLWRCKELIEGMLDSLGEIHAELDHLESNFEGGMEEKINTVESRLFILRDLARKHNCTVNELPLCFAELNQKLDTLSQGTISITHLEKEAQVAKNTYYNLGLAISEARHAASESLKDKLQQILASLKLPHVNFYVNFEALPDHQWTAAGVEKIEFWVSLNPGIPAGPLKSVASGGELSRLMLALKVLMKDQHGVGTLIFDEIDTGLGGAVAASMGKYLKQLSHNTQVIAITHSPQLAAYGNHHLYVLKTSTEFYTHTTMMYLDKEEEKATELARMLSGKEITNQTKAAALELRQGALHDQPL